MTGHSKTLRGAALALALASLAIPAFAQDSDDMLADEVSVSAKIVALDVPNRLMILEGPAGGYSRVIEIPAAVANLPQVQPGDTVTVRYLQAMLAKVEAAPALQPGVEVTETTVKAAPGELPAGAKVRQITMTAKLLAYDSNKHLAILDGPGDTDREVAVEGPELKQAMTAFKPGDIVRVTFTEAVAVEVTR